MSKKKQPEGKKRLEWGPRPDGSFVVNNDPEPEPKPPAKKEDE